MSAFKSYQMREYDKYVNNGYYASMNVYFGAALVVAWREKKGTALYMQKWSYRVKQAIHNFFYAPAGF